MHNRLRAERARGDLDVLSRAGLDLDDFIGEATSTVQNAIPWVGACVGTHDPATMMLTSARKYGTLAANNEHDALWGYLEYDIAEETSFRSLVLAGVRAIGMKAAGHVDDDRSERMNRLMRPMYGFTDEARLVFHDSAGMWGCLALFRGPDTPAFDDQEVTFLGSLSESFARGVRTGMLTRLAEISVATDVPGPAVVIVDAQGAVSQISLGAEERLAQLSTSVNSGDPLAIVTSLVGAARRVRSEPGSSIPRTRVRTASGAWLVLHASPLAGSAGAVGDVVVTIEEARPPEIVALVVAACGLTPRERDVTSLVLQGVDTKEIAAKMHVSAYTVQDHLKSVFEKVGVRSRRELISRIYFDQYVPRMGGEIAPTGWFTA
ncbi:MAG: helix-turn-helix transcriptional regulator [Microbacterium sp.]|uniref:helix-turn-helix transcriptional regulator n=1 Tax=Microbacterium sp. TaxID=51671 RepID=UPI003BAF927A